MSTTPLLTLCKEHDCTSRVSCRPEALKRECRPIRGIPVHTAVGDTPTGMFVSARDPTCSSPHHKAVAVKPVCQISSSMSENTSTHSGRSLLTSPQLASTFGLSLCYAFRFSPTRLWSLTPGHKPHSQHYPHGYRYHLCFRSRPAQR